MEPVIGPGGIAWSAGALVINRLAGIVADRSARAWFAFGAVGTATVTLVHRLALLPLGITEPWRWIDLVLSLGLTALWCGTVGWIRALEVKPFYSLVRVAGETPSDPIQSDDVIVNDGSPEQLRRQMVALHYRYMSLASDDQ